MRGHVANPHTHTHTNKHRRASIRTHSSARTARHKARHTARLLPPATSMDSMVAWTSMDQHPVTSMAPLSIRAMIYGITSTRVLCHLRHKRHLRHNKARPTHSSASRSHVTPPRACTALSPTPECAQHRQACSVLTAVERGGGGGFVQRDSALTARRRSAARPWSTYAPLTRALVYGPGCMRLTSGRAGRRACRLTSV
jgi:hypothetical protein